MIERQIALYAYLLKKGERYTLQNEIANDLFEYYGNDESFFGLKEFHDTHKRCVLSEDISQINSNKEFEKIIISSPRGIKLANEEEFDRYVKSQYNSAIRKLARVYAMAKKGNRHGQIDFGGHTVESFLENLPETT